MKKNRRRPRHPAHPLLWHVWLLLPLTLLLAWFPWTLQRFIGNRLGDLTWLLLRERRRVTLRNLELCFPDWPPERRQSVALESFRSAGIALFESSRAWWQPPATVARDFEIRGLEHIRAAQEKGCGVLLLGAHYMPLEIAGAAVSAVQPLDTIYRPQNNPALDTFVRWRRNRIYQWQIDRRDIRTVYKALKANHAVWYTGDQDFGRKHAVFVPFFGVNAATVTAGARFARANGAAAISVDFRRDDATGRYIVEFSQPLADFPGETDETGARTMNRWIEAGILKAPGQYMWFHRRFKTQPDRHGTNPY
ncbi:MAG: LpxL/LpxP family Kdo(2)-lipid IV(A) lauroyl/palmitoleoyl acyltransferase [Pseudomonadota bacterium]